MIYLFTTKSCPKCEITKRFIKNRNVEEKIGSINIMDTTTDEGRDKAIKFSLRAAPTLVVTDNNDNVIEQFSGDGLIIHYFEEKMK